MRQHRTRAEAEAEQDQLGMLAEFTHLQRRAQPDEEQRAEKPSVMPNS